MFTTFDKAWIPALVTVIGAVVLQMTGTGEGPTPEQVGVLGDLGGEAVVAAVMAILTYLVPNKKAA